MQSGPQRGIQLMLPALRGFVDSGSENPRKNAAYVAEVVRQGDTTRRGVKNAASVDRKRLSSADYPRLGKRHTSPSRKSGNASRKVSVGRISVIFRGRKNSKPRPTRQVDDKEATISRLPVVWQQSREDRPSM